MTFALGEAETILLARLLQHWQLLAACTSQLEHIVA